MFGVLVQYPAMDGVAARPVARWPPPRTTPGALVTASADLLALTLATPPGEWGADVAVGTTQRFGVPMGFGGPHAGYMSVRQGLERTMPGSARRASPSTPSGAPAYRLALQTREQHIRREKATSNICTAQVLLAVMASMYAVYHGPAGLRAIALGVHAHAEALRDALVDGGVEVTEGAGLRHAAGAGARAGPARSSTRPWPPGVNLWRVDDDTVQLSVDETTDLVDLGRVAKAFGVVAPERVRHAAPQWQEALVRTSDYLTHPVFSTHHSETAMLRYLRRLADRDFALDRGMIPLGSCTMKLNATTEMVAVTWPEFAEVHPFAPHEQTRGIRGLVDELSGWLCEITGYDAVSLQPNAGSQGELAGLLAIAAYHRSRGDDQRTRVPHPVQRARHQRRQRRDGRPQASSSSRPTRSPATSTWTTSRPRSRQHRDTLAAIMVTYPSTHGVFEDTITDLCAMVHDAGGQVYVDGANLNALVGVARPGKFGADVSHLNLHKTFCIPHGGGGPGVGPVGVRAHLAPFLPNHPLDPAAGPETGVGPISGAPYGSASILPISWAYVRLMGGAGLRRATEVAVLNANYVAARLREHYPVLYSGHDGLVAHECILDLRGITKETGVTVDDVAKRLIDYGFHAPTMSFPVAGTLMVEPTESEDKGELDRFCDAMIAIRRRDRRGGLGSGRRRRQRAARRPAHGRGARRRVGPRLRPSHRRLPRRASTPPRSTGRRCAASTVPTATATSSARAPRRRRSRTERPRWPGLPLRRRARPAGRRPAPRRCCRPAPLCTTAWWVTRARRSATWLTTPTARPPSRRESSTVSTCSRLSSSRLPKPSSMKSVPRSSPPVSSRTASARPRARAREAMNDSPPDRVAVSRTRPVHWSRTRRPRPDRAPRAARSSECSRT